MRYLLDTNICIFAYKKNLAVLRRLRHHSPDDLRVSSVTLAEISYGVEKSVHRTENETFWNTFFEPYEILDFDRLAAKQYGSIRVALEKSGQMIGERDCQIASIARAHHLTIVTNNVREFSRVSGLKVEDWTI
ncbi:MAG: type II toxin-antitoxin system VapC family toxin [Deltaproteobacteria bacterium]|nr:type II toxin-antitoxin system VapC family toxin [Deltaproteobacteria bacterium]